MHRFELSHLGRVLVADEYVRRVRALDVDAEALGCISVGELVEVVPDDETQPQLDEDSDGPGLQVVRREQLREREGRESEEEDARGRAGLGRFSRPRST